MPIILNPTREFEIIESVKKDSERVYSEYRTFYLNPGNKHKNFAGYIKSIGINLIELANASHNRYEAIIGIDDSLYIRHVKTEVFNFFSFYNSDDPPDSFWLDRVTYGRDGVPEFKFMRSTDMFDYETYTIGLTNGYRSINDEFDLDLPENYFEWTNDHLMMLKLVMN